MTALMLAGCAPAPDPNDELNQDSDAVDTDALLDCEAPLEDVRGHPACGARLFMATCTTCHAEDGTGTGLGPDLNNHVPNHSDVELLFVLRLGSGDMPPSELADPGNNHVLAWLRDEFGEQSGAHE